MKRSQMLEILEEALNDHCYGDYLPKVYSAKVLEELENAGMLPPQRTEEKKHYFTNGEKWHTSEFIEYHCKWEEE